MMSASHPRFYRNLNSIRRSVQVFSLLFLLAVPVLNWLGVHWLIGSLYSISIGELVITDPVMVLQMILLSKKIYLPLLLSLLVPVALAFVFGRVFCSWMCPQNTISEWIDAIQKHAMKRRWRNEHIRHSEQNPSPLLYWGVFAGLTILLLVSGMPIFGYLSAPGIISSQMSRVVFGQGLGLEIGLVLLIFAGEIFMLHRFWCKYLCPVGAFLSVFRTRKTLHLQHQAMMCDCKGDFAPCHYTCPLNLSPKLSNIYPYCFNCGLCISVCERTGNTALSFTFAEDNRGEKSQIGTDHHRPLHIARSGE